MARTPREIVHEQMRHWAAATEDPDPDKYPEWFFVAPEPLALQPDYGSPKGAAVPRGRDNPQYERQQEMLRRITASYAEKQAFNKENGPELLGQLLRVLKSNGMDDALQAIKSCGLTRKLNDEWMSDTRNRQKRKRDRRAGQQSLSALSNDFHDVHDAVDMTRKTYRPLALVLGRLAKPRGSMDDPIFRSGYLEDVDEAIEQIQDIEWAAPRLYMVQSALSDALSELVPLSKKLRRLQSRRAAVKVDPEMLKAWKRHVLKNQRRWGRHDADDWLDEAISYAEEYWKAMNLDPGDDVPMREVERWAEKQAPGLIAFAQWTDLMPKMAKEHASEKAKKQWFEDHPNMTDEQKSKHTVKEEGGGGAVEDLTSAASAMLDKMPDDVQKFVKDKPHRDKVLKEVASDLRKNAPKYVKEVKKGLGPEVKAAVEGVEALSKGDSPSSDQKKAMRNLAVEVTAAVSTKGVPGAAALIGMKVLKHIAVTALNAVLGTHFGQQPATAKVAALGEDQFIAELLVAVGDELGKGISEKDLIDSLNSAPEKKASARRVATAYQIKTGKRKEVPRRPFRHPGGQKHRLDPEGRPGARPPDTYEDVAPGRGSAQYIRAVERMLQKRMPDKKILHSLTTKWRLSPRDAKRELDRIKGQLRLAKKNYSLTDFHRAAIDTDEAISKAYLESVSLKSMWDTFEEIPPKQRRMYDDNMKVMSLLRKAGDEAYQTRMTLKKYR